MLNKPYIGVTDFVTRVDVERIKAITSPKRRLHVGAMTSFKVLNGIKTSTGWENIWLNEHQLNELFVQDDDVFNVIHYADYGHQQTSPAPTDLADLLKAIDMCGPNVHGIQLDMVWPDPILVDRVKQLRPNIKIILQISSTALIDMVCQWHTTLDIITEAYIDSVDYFLLDSGMGRGTQMIVEHTLSNISTLLNCGIQEHQIAVAGGLGPETYEAMRPLFDVYPHLSCDAQGRLRPTHTAVDPLNMDMVESYVKGVSSLIR